MGQRGNRVKPQLERETAPHVNRAGIKPQENLSAVAKEIRHGGGDEDQVADAEPRLREDEQDVDEEAAGGAADGLAEVAEGGDGGEAAGEGFELAAGADEEHHAEEGEGGDEEEGEEAEEPSGFLEGVREAEDAGADDGDEDVGEGLGLGGEGSWAEEWGVFSWDVEGVGG